MLCLNSLSLRSPVFLVGVAAADVAVVVSVFAAVAVFATAADVTAVTAVFTVVTVATVVGGGVVTALAVVAVVEMNLLLKAGCFRPSLDTSTYS